MPAGISALAPSLATFNARDASMELSAVKAFTILQKDGLDSSFPPLRVNGERDAEEEEDDDDSVISKMTTIKRNFRNNDSSIFARRQLSRSNDHLAPVDLPSHLRARGYSKSHGHLNKFDKRLAPREHGFKTNSMHLSTEDFNQVLNAKLKKIQEQAEEEHRRQAAKACYVQHPKPFITTVKTGEFLMPPPEVAVILGITPSHAGESDVEDIDGMYCRSRIRRHLVSLNRKPEVRYQTHKSRCQVALKATEDFTLGGFTNASALTNARRNYKKESHQT